MVIGEATRSTTAHPVPPHWPGRATTTLGLLVAVLVGGGLALGLAMRTLSLITETSAPSVDALVEVAVCGFGALVAGWLAASALLALGCLALRLVGSSWRLGERLVHRWAPAVVRRSLVLVVGATVGLGAATGASAAAAPAPSPTASAVSVAADDLGWVVTTPAGSATSGVAAPTIDAQAVSPTAPTEASADAPPGAPAQAGAPAGAPAHAAAVVTPAATAGVASAAAEPAPEAPLPPTPPTSSDSERVVVADGDSLWAIAARHLAPAATDAQIAASWPQWYYVNRSVIGPDPSRIVPGQVLTAPVARGGAS